MKDDGHRVIEAAKPQPVSAASHGARNIRLPAEAHDARIEG